MNKYQKNFLIVCAVTFVVCAGRILTGPGSLQNKLAMVCVYWIGMGLVFGVCVTRLKAQQQPRAARPRKQARELPPKA